MATLAYVQDYSGGTSKRVRRVAKQGAPVKPIEIKCTRAVIVHMTEREYQDFISASNGMKKSAFGRLVFSSGITYLNRINV